MMASVADLSLGQVITNAELKRVFKVGMMGGMRRSLRTNSLVLVSDHTKGIYHDRWEGVILHYTGMGKTGNQSLRSQNRTVAESPVNSVALHLFEVHKQNEYRYCGEVVLAGSPYQENQPDVDGTLRKVWIFPLRPVTGQLPGPVPIDHPKKTNEQREREAHLLSDEELARRAAVGTKHPAKVATQTIAYYRDPYVAEYARRRAKGDCQLCGKMAPFKNAKKQPYLEVHHIKWLADGGADTTDNTIALCPNCHRRMHILKDPKDILRLIAEARKTI